MLLHLEQNYKQVVRSGGRLENADYLSFDIKYPIKLPGGNWLTKLTVNYYSEKDHHVAGQNQILAKIMKYLKDSGSKEVEKE